MIDEPSVCVDAGLVVKLVVWEPDSDRARALFAQWQTRNTRLIAPEFFQVETDSILRKKFRLRGELAPDQADLAFASLQSLDVRTFSLPDQRQRAWEIARSLDLPTVYDATYLALAELSGCEFWTADERLYNQVGNHLPFVRWLGDYVPAAKP